MADPFMNPDYVQSLRDEVARLRREVYALRLFGNKDCTAQADEYLANQLQPSSPASPCYRAWRLEEVPLGALVRPLNPYGQINVQYQIAECVDTPSGQRCLFRKLNSQIIITVPIQDLMQYWEWRHPEDTDWKPCGVKL